MNLSPEEIARERKKAYEAVNKVRTKHGLEPIPFSDDPEPFYCSFCGKEPEKVKSMVGGVRTEKGDRFIFCIGPKKVRTEKGDRFIFCIR